MKRRTTIILLGLVALFTAGIMALAFSPAKRALWQLYLSAFVYDAIKAGDSSQVEELMQRGANPNRFGAGGLVGGTPVAWAIEKSDPSILKVLIKYGGHVNRDSDGFVPMDYSLGINRDNLERHRETKDSAQIIEVLKRAGAREVAHAQSATSSNR
jgi:hypothetical protein